MALGAGLGDLGMEGLGTPSASGLAGVGLGALGANSARGDEQGRSQRLELVKDILKVCRGVLQQQDWC